MCLVPRGFDSFENCQETAQRWWTSVPMQTPEGGQVLSPGGLGGQWMAVHGSVEGQGCPGLPPGSRRSLEDALVVMGGRTQEGTRRFGLLLSEHTCTWLR